MKILFIGGTGNISTCVSKRVIAAGHELYILNRGKRPVQIEGAHSIVADINDEAATASAIGDQTFDVVANFIGFTAADIERDIRLFNGRCAQYIFISSASAYQKPLANLFVTESTPLANPYWQYSRDKIACELRVNQAYREEQFPGTIIRPSLTYDTVIPVAIGSWDDFPIVDRIRQGKPIISHGDGSNLWTITHADDFAKGMLGLMGNQQAIGDSFHITSDEVLTWDQIYQAVMDAAGRSVEIVHIPSDFIAKCVPWQEGNLHGDKAVSAVFDNSKLKRLVPDFVATTPFKVGIKRTVEWFDADPSRIRIDDGSNKMMDAIIERYKAVYDNLTPL